MIRLKKQVPVLTGLLFLLAACSQKPVSPAGNGPQPPAAAAPKEKTGGAEDMEAKVMRAISDLPEVIKASDYIDSISGHQKGVAYIIDPPRRDGDQPGCYSVQVGYNGEERFETYYFLYVDTVSFKVKVHDLVLDTIVPVEVWRSREKEDN